MHDPQVDCLFGRDDISMPPNPFGEEIGVGLVLSSDEQVTWGESLVGSVVPLPEAQHNYVDPRLRPGPDIAVTRLDAS